MTVNVGDVFGDLTVIDFTLKEYGKEDKTRKRKVAKCVCKCGQTNTALLYHLTLGKTTHCGCKRNKNQVANRLNFGESSLNKMLCSYKAGARKRNLSFELSKVQVTELFAGNCYYCGTPPENVAKARAGYGHFIYNGIDRLDSSKGYVEGNVVSCCKVCNFLKGTHSYSEFLEYIKRIAVHHKLCE